MPNYCFNQVKAPKKVLEDLYMDGKITFQKLIPMPKSLMLEKGSETEKAVLYAVLKKDYATRSNLINLLSNTSEEFRRNYWQRLTRSFSLDKPNGLVDVMKKLEEEQKKFVPDEDEKKLGIKTFEQLGDTYIDNLIKYKSMTWYKWSIENWGTKWDAFECHGKPEEELLTFITAWAPPDPIIEKLLRKYSNEKIEWEYEEEGTEIKGKYSTDGKGNIYQEEYELKYSEEDDEEEEY